MTNKINQNWVFGRKVVLDFAPLSPTADSVMNAPAGCACISNANGQLIMYTDGQAVWDGAHTPKLSGLPGDPASTQSAIIVPDPANALKYYVFTTTVDNHHLKCTLIDTGPGTWSATQISMLEDLSLSSTEKVTAIQHTNCRDFWVVTIIHDGLPHASGPGKFSVFLVDPTGVHHHAYISMNNVQVHNRGYLKGSKDGKRIAFANWTNHNVLVYPFDNTNGHITAGPIIATPDVPGSKWGTYGVEFSPNNTILYYTVERGVASGQVFQVELPNPSSVQVGSSHANAGGEGTFSLGALQLGMDGRIYIAQDGEPRLGVIADPDDPGADCHLTFDSLSLATASICRRGLPNLIPNLCDFGCGECICAEAVEVANQILDERADTKFITIMANGQQAEVPCGLAFQDINFSPIFSLHWGDGPSDQFEAHDTEIIYIRIRNPFMNLIYRGVKIFNIQISPNQVLPDGENALQLIPAEIACFDEIEPCSSVSRDFAFLIQNAVVQSYQITFDYCIDEIAICGSSHGSKAFGINVVAS